MESSRSQVDNFLVSLRIVLHYYNSHWQNVEEPFHMPPTSTSVNCLQISVNMKIYVETKLWFKKLADERLNSRFLPKADCRETIPDHVWFPGRGQDRLIALKLRILQSSLSKFPVALTVFQFVRHGKKMKPSIFNLYHLSNHLVSNLKLSNAGVPREFSH